MVSAEKIFLSPMSRLAICIAVGIFFSDTFMQPDGFIEWHIVALGILLLICLALFRSRVDKFKNLFGIFAMMFAFTVGSMATSIKWNEVRTEWSNECNVYKGVVGDEPERKDKYNRFIIYVEDRSILCNTANDSIVRELRPGDEILFYGRIKLPKNNGNPYEFDYKSYLYHNGISGTVFLSEGEMCLLKSAESLSFKENAMLLRSKIVEKYKEWNIKDESLALLSAITVGKKSYLTDEMKSDYSNAGLSHILALSGMHIGMLLMILDLLLGFMKRRFAFRMVRFFIIAAVLCTFAFVGGLSASLVRAVIMCLLLEITLLGKEKRNGINLVFVSGMVMLIYNPFYLFDVGFQLSYMAVISILLLSRPFFKLFSFNNYIIRKIYGIISVSVAAQIGTAPLVIYYFSNFSVVFFISNIFSSFLVMLIMIFTFISFVVPFAGLHYMLSLLLSVQNWLTHNISSLPFAVIEGVSISVAELILFYIVALCAMLWLMYRKRVFILIFIGVASCFSLLLAVNRVESRLLPHAVVYKNAGNSAFHFIENDGRNYLTTAIDEKEMNDIHYSVKEYVNKNKLDKITVIDSYNDDKIVSKEGIVRWRGMNFCVVYDNRWRMRMAPLPMNIDYMYINYRYYDSITSLQKVFYIKKIILDSRLSATRLEDYRKECDELGIEYIDLSQQGYYKIII